MFEQFFQYVVLCLQSSLCMYPIMITHIATFDVQHASIYTGPGEINVTCCFAVGSQALGCHVLIYMSTTPVAFGDIRRENTTDSSSMKWYLSDSATKVFSALEVGIYDVVLYEIEKDNTIDFDNRVHAETVQITKPQVAMATTNTVPTVDITSVTTSAVSTSVTFISSQLTADI